MVLYEYVTFSSWLLLYFEVRPTFSMREVTIILREILQTSLPEKPGDIFQSNCILKSLRADLWKGERHRGGNPSYEYKLYPSLQLAPNP